MSLTTCNVICTINDDSGVPVVGAVITARLNRFEVYLGYVVPTLVQGVTDATGHVTLALWPNELGSTESMYVVKVLAPNGKSLTVNAVVPNVTSTQLHLIATLPAYTGKTDGELILTAAVEAGSLAVSKAAEAVVSATAASVSAAASQVSKLASDASATLASNKATVATTQATIATTQATQSAAANAVSNAAALASANTSTAQAVISTNQAVVATQQAVIATTQATNSATSAAGSLASSVVATTKASEASASAVEALGNADAIVLNVLTATQRAQQAASSVVAVADELDVMDIKISTANATMASSVQAASTSATNAANTAATMAATLASFRGVYLGAFASDAAAASFAVANSIVLLAGVMYENTAAFKFRIYNGTAWIDYDATAQASQSAAVLSATNAASSASTASTQADIATTQATNAASSASSAASSLAAVAAVTTGNMSSQNANAVAITGGAVSGTSITVKDNVFTLQDDVDPTKQAQFQLSGLVTAQTTVYTLPVGFSAASLLLDAPTTQTINGIKTFSSATINVGSSTAASTQQFAYGAITTGLTKTVNIGTGGLSGSTTNITVGSANGSTTTMLGSTVIGGASGNQSLQVNNVASAVNYAQIVGAVTGGSPGIAAQGADANISLFLSQKGTGTVYIGGNGTIGSLQVSTPASMVNSFGVYGNTTGNAPSLTVIGSDTNIGLGISSKGIGAIQLFSGANESFRFGNTGNSDFTNYYTTTGQLNYTAAGGSANTSFYFGAKGTGSIQLASGGGTQAVVSNTASAVNYLNLTGAATGAAPTISAQGSDANINLALTTKATGGHTFNTGGGQQFAVAHTASAVDYLQATGNSGGFPSLSAQGASANVAIVYGTKGTGGHNFTTNGLSVNQFVVSHSASAVNYAQVSGAVTGSPVIITAQGSDANVSLAYAPKGTGKHTFYSNSGTQFVIGNTASVVNYMQIDGATTGAAPTISAAGSDANIGLVLSSKGTGVVALGGSTAANSSVQVFPVASSVNYIALSGASAGNSPALGVGGTNANVSFIFQTKGSGGYGFYTNYNTAQAAISHTASAVNYLQLTGAVTTGAPELSAQGSDGNIDLLLRSKGTGVVALGGTTAANSSLQVAPIPLSINFAQISGNTVGFGPIISAQGLDSNIALQLRSKGNFGIGFQSSVASNIADFVPTYEGYGVNFLRFTSAITTRAPSFSAQGSDTNISLAVHAKGTGAIDLAAGSSGINISNGGTVTSVVLTTTGYAHLTQSSAVVSAPTTAGGVQATLTVRMGINTAPVATGGTGYAVGDVLTIVGGTPVTLAATLTVASVSANGVITSVNSTNFTPYNVLPSSPASVTSLTGSGSGATFNPLWYTHSLAVANAGSGYVEQPTITFSGGGGSLAAAYAVVGSGTTIKSLGSTLSLNANGYTGLQVGSGANAVDYFYLSSGTAYLYFGSAGASTNIGYTFQSKGSGSFNFKTGNSETQLVIAHTSSAVNYIAVTGSTASGAPLYGAGPTISAVGSDTSINLNLVAKGLGAVTLQSSGATVLNVSSSGTGVGNFINIYPTTGYMNWTLAGADTNIGYLLSTKGTGAFGFTTGGGQQVAVVNTALAVNYITLTGAPTNAGYVGSPAPTISAAGSDANVSLKLAGKGTGFVLSSSPMLIQRSYGGTSLLGLGGSTIFTAGTTAAGVDNDTVIDSTKTSAYTAYSTYVSTAAAAFNLSSLAHYKAQFYQLGAGSAINNQYGFFADAGLSAAVNNFGFYSGLAAAANRYNFYAAGTADNVFVGQTSLGGTQGTEALRAVTTTSAVNWLQAAGSQTGGGYAPTLSSQGSDPDINLLIKGKGTGSVFIGSAGNVGGGSLCASPITSSVNYVQVLGAVPTGSPQILAAGQDAVIALNISSKSFGNVNINTGTGTVATFQDRGTATVTSPFVFRAGTVGAAAGTLTLPVAVSIQVPDDQYTFKTNASATGANSGLTQFTIVSAALAVNYLQVKGAGTNSAPSLSAQGSDNDIGLNLTAKNSGSIALYNGYGISARFYGGTNNFAIAGVGSGNSPEISAQGSDGNLNIKLTPKGTGTLQFGTYTAGVLSPTGYITITDAAGTSRRLLVG